MSLTRYLHHSIKFPVPSKDVQERIVRKVRIREEPGLNTVPQDPKCRSSIAKEAVRLRNLVSCFGITHSALVDLFLRCIQDLETLLLLIFYTVAERFANLGLQKKKIEFKRPVEVPFRAIAITFPDAPDPLIGLPQES